MTTSYSEKLRDPRWQKKRLKILQRDGFKCKLCGNDEAELHVHHLKYSGDPWEAKNIDLQTVCKFCHICIHQFKGKDYAQIDKIFYIKYDYYLCRFKETKEASIVHINDMDEANVILYKEDFSGIIACLKHQFYED